MSSQRYLDEEIVEAKMVAKDYDVKISPEFLFEGETYRVVLDGHHSLEAARRDGVEPEMIEATSADCDDLDDLSSVDDVVIGAWLQRHHSGESGVEWYDIATGQLVW